MPHRGVRTRLTATVEEMRAQAERVRLEAELLEQRLTLTKIERLEQKLENKNWLAKHPEEEEALERQLQALQRKLVVSPSNSQTTIGVSAVPVTGQFENTNNNTMDASLVRKAEVVAAASSINGVETLSNMQSKPSTSSLEPSSASLSVRKSPRQELVENPISGFDQDDLDAYLPVAQQIEATMPNSTIDEKVVAFRAAPQLQEHFQKKIRAMILQPMEDVQKLEELRSQFLYTRSRIEKENLRRQIAQMEKELEKGGPFGYSESVFADVPPMTDEEMQQRLEAVGNLPPVLQALYTRRTHAPNGDTRLTIELDHYEAQLQLLYQVKYIQPMTEEVLEETRTAIASLPLSVRKHVAKKCGLDSSIGEDTAELLNALTKSSTDTESTKEWSNMQDFVVAAGASGEETDNLDYIDRSRYAEEFYPAIARMEGKHPSRNDMDLFIKDVVDRRAFMVESKPERVVGGWYLRGRNLLSDDEDGVKLVKCLAERLGASPHLSEKIEFFYVPDPSPMADEDFEMDSPVANVVYVTGKDPVKFYNNSGAFSKFFISAFGIAMMAVFSLATVEMVPHLQERLDSALTTGKEDLEWLKNTVSPTFLSMITIYAVHEAGHAIIATRDKFEIGFGGPIPSIQTGFFGAITPFKSPPPSMKSMFDFAMAGPMLGFITSLAFFVKGLQETAAVDMNASMGFPGLPTFLLRSSALCSELVEFVLGKGTLLPGVELPAEAVLPLHPFAIAGYVGLVVNALALLPLGRKYTENVRVCAL